MADEGTGNGVPGPGGGARTRVLVLGGGFGGLETAFDLRLLAGDRADITVVSDQDHFLFKPNSIYVPFGLDPDRLKVPLAKPMAKRGIELVQGRADAIDPDRRQVQVDGRKLSYDQLVIATGSGMRPSEIPGLAEHATTMWTPEEMLENGMLLVGSADTVSRQMERILADTPMRWLFAWTYNGLVPNAKILRSLELFSTKVLPRFADAPAG